MSRALVVALALLLSPATAHADACSDAGFAGTTLDVCRKAAGPCKYSRGAAMTACEQRAVAKARREAEREAAAAEQAEGAPAAEEAAPAARAEGGASTARNPPPGVAMEAPEASGTPPAVDPATRSADVDELKAAAAQVEALGNWTEWTLSELASERIGDNAPMMQEKLARQREALAVGVQARAVLERFQSRYLAHLADWQSSYNELNNAFEDLSPSLGSREYSTVEQGLEGIERAPAKNARRCLEILETNGTDPAMLDALHEIYRTKAIVEARQLLGICPAFAPDDPAIAAAADALRPRVEQTLEQYKAAEMKAIEGRSWQRNVGSVSSGSPSALASAGLAYLRGERSWGGDASKGTRVLAVSVRGDWFVAERDLFGRPTRWGLPVHAAVVTNDTMDGVAQVFDLSLVTTASAQQAPFGAFRVGDTWLVLRDKVP